MVFYKRCGAKLRYAIVFVLDGQIQYGIIGEDCEREFFRPWRTEARFHQTDRSLFLKNGNGKAETEKTWIF